MLDVRFTPLSCCLYHVSIFLGSFPSQHEDIHPITTTPNRKVNLRGVFLGSKYACTQFLKQDISPSGHRGWIINTASGAGLKGVGGGASKYIHETTFPTNAKDRLWLPPY